jgi:hypothetical protein
VAVLSFSHPIPSTGRKAGRREERGGERGGGAEREKIETCIVLSMNKFEVVKSAIKIGGSAQRLVDLQHNARP